MKIFLMVIVVLLYCVVTMLTIMSLFNLGGIKADEKYKTALYTAFVAEIAVGFWATFRTITSPANGQTQTPQQGAETPLSPLPVATQERMMSATLIQGKKELNKQLIETVSGAEKFIVTTGSRARDKIYLSTIEEKIKSTPELIYHRILFGPPQRVELMTHLTNVLKYREGAEKQDYIKLAIFNKILEESEQSICCSEKRCIIALPSVINGLFESGILIENESYAQSIYQHVRNLHGKSMEVTLSNVSKIPVIYDGEKQIVLSKEQYLLYFFNVN